jgi:signal transduction histidine kinase/CheY-like chemotaxis protein
VENGHYFREDNSVSKSVSVEKDFFDQILNSSRSMISIINRNYIYEKVNSTFCREHQTVHDSVVGKSLSEVWGDETFRKYIKSKLDLCFSGEIVSYETSLSMARQGQRYYEVVFRPLSAGNDVVSHLLAETFDIHELKLSRQEAFDKDEELRKLEKKLIQAQKLEAIGSLAGGIAHDFNNILATISGYSEMLQDDLPDNSPLSDSVSKIRNAVQKAQSIVNQMLTFSRHVEQEKIAVNIAEILAETIGFVRSYLSPDIIIKSRISGRKAEVLADPTQLFRVFLNIMTNAIQSMDDSGGTLSVKMEIADGKKVQNKLKRDIVADEYVLLSFADTGKGMESSTLDRIFEPFFTTRDVGKGLGLGLSVIHGIIKELEGEVLVTSKKDHGSVFYIYLPVVKEYSDSSAINETRKKILFITGNRHESRILSIALEKSGYDLIYMTDRQSFVNIMGPPGKQPDLIIYMCESKLLLPDEMITVYQQLRIETPCIFITGSHPDQVEENLLNSGFVKQHLTKPVSLKEMRNAILVSLSQNEF